MRRRTLSVGIIALVSFLAAPKQVQAQVTMGQAGSAVTNDFKYLVDNAQLDLEDVVTSPLYVASPNSALRSPRFYLVLAGAGAIWGGSFALDQTMRSHLRSMSSSDADLLQNVSYGSVAAATALLYGYGLYVGDARAREYAHLPAARGQG